MGGPRLPVFTSLCGCVCVCGERGGGQFGALYIITEGGIGIQALTL